MLLVSMTLGFIAFSINNIKPEALPTIESGTGELSGFLISIDNSLTILAL